MTELLSNLEPDEAEPLADRRGGRAHLMVELCGAGRLQRRRFLERDEFLDVAWQEVAATRFLTAGRTRTIGAVAETILREYGSFAALVASQDLSESQRGAFRTCADIEHDLGLQGFASYEWYEPWLVPASPGDHGTSTTEWYVAEGVHSTLVRAVAFVREPDLWQPVDAVVCCDRVV